MKVGVQTRIGKVLPGSRYLEAVKLSRQAKARLVWMDYYEQCGNAALTCRRFGISRVTLHKWLKRYRRWDLLSLEDRSRRPKKTRKPTTPSETVGLVKRLRNKNPEYSKYKLSVLLKRDCGLEVSASTVGRILKCSGLVFPTSKKQPRRAAGQHRQIKPAGLKAFKVGQLVEFDLKHIKAFAGRKRYAFVAVDVVSKQAFVKVSGTPSSAQALLAWEGAVKRLGKPEIVITDHGYENLGAFAERLARDGKTAHYFARVRQPKDKPCVERFINSLEAECLSRGGLEATVEEQQRSVDRWLAKYHFYRPHAALNYLTPHEFSSKMEASEV